MKRSKQEIKGVKAFNFMSMTLTWLGTLTKVNAAKIMSLRKVLSKISSVYIHRGPKECIKYSKGLRTSFIKYLILYSEGVQSSLPKILLPFKTLLSGDVWDYPLIRLVLTCTYSTRFIRLKEEPSFKSITDGPGESRISPNEREEIREFLVKGLGINPVKLGVIPKSLRFKKYHMTSKSGPNGHALWCSFKDAIILPDDLKQSIKIVAGDRLIQLFNKLTSLYSQIPGFFWAFTPQGVKGFRKITCIRDKEGKTREVAILDYWSQAALKPLHEYLYRTLRRIDQDCTHDQAKHLGKLIPTLGSSFHSIDLTTATDRFPIEIERLILECWFGKDYSEHWKNIMVKYPFDYKGHKLIYGTGNPMGAYSSFSTFALGHHYAVYKACKGIIKWRNCPYMLLGDDIVIANDKVANRYKEILSGWNVPINENKTHVSPYLYEFAKQFIFNNKNISPFPIAALYEQKKSLFTVASIILRELSYKDWNSDIMDALKLYLRDVLRFNNKRILKVLPKLRLGIGLILHLQGKSDLGISIMEYVAETTGKKPKWPAMTRAMYSQYIAGNTVTEMFLLARDKITSNSNKLPLGELATQMVCAITSLRDGGMDCFDLIESVPFLQIYGRAEETYIKLMKPTIGARLIKDGSQMRAALDIVDIPTSDQDFYVRHRDVLIIRALRASKLIEGMVKKHLMERKASFYTNPILPTREMMAGLLKAPRD